MDTECWLAAWWALRLPVTTNKMHQSRNVPTDRVKVILSLFHCCNLLVIKPTTITATASAAATTNTLAVAITTTTTTTTATTTTPPRTSLLLLQPLLPLSPLQFPPLPALSPLPQPLSPLLPSTTLPLPLIFVFNSLLFKCRQMCICFFRNR